LDDIKRVIQEACKSRPSNHEVEYADVLCSVMSPSSSSDGDEFSTEWNLLFWWFVYGQ
jgi:hypothetical protein